MRLLQRYTQNIQARQVRSMGKCVRGDEVRKQHKQGGHADLEHAETGQMSNLSRR